MSVLKKTYNLKQSAVRSDVFHSAAIYKGHKTNQVLYHKAPAPSRSSSVLLWESDLQEIMTVNGKHIICVALGARDMRILDHE